MSAHILCPPGCAEDHRVRCMRCARPLRFYQAALCDPCLDEARSPWWWGW